MNYPETNCQQIIPEIYSTGDGFTACQRGGARFIALPENTKYEQRVLRNPVCGIIFA